MSVPTPVVSVAPIVLPAPARGDDLQVRVSAPGIGSDLPVVVFAHGFGQSMSGYDPLVDHWAGHGFVVVRPTFLDSRTLDVAPTDPRHPHIWRTRVDDVVRVLDDLGHLVAAVPGLAGRVDLDRLAVAGHSWGGQTASMLLGAGVVGEESRIDPRVRAGVLLATTGVGGAELTPFAVANFPFMNPDFAGLTTPTLVVAGDHDRSALSTRGPDWFTDVYHRSPGADALLTVFGGEHSLGGIHAYGAADTTDEDPARVALIRQVTTAYLRHALGVDDRDWKELPTVGPTGRLDTK